MDGIRTGEAWSWLGLAHKRLPWWRWERGIKRLWVCSLVRRKLLVSLETKIKSCSGSSTSAARKRRRWMMWCGKEGSFLSGPQWERKKTRHARCKDMSEVNACSEKCKPIVRTASNHSEVRRRYSADYLSRFKSCSPDNQSQKEMSFC